jgi:hypothetical protein
MEKARGRITEVRGIKGFFVHIVKWPDPEAEVKN